MPGAQKTIIINTSPDKIYSVIVDYLNYPVFLKDVTSAQIDSKTGNTTVASFAIDIKVKKINYTIRLTEEENTSVSWTLVKGDFMEENNGSWHLKDLGDGRTEATYSVDIVPKVPRSLALLKGKISKALAKTSLPDTLAAFKSRAESLS